MIKKHAERLPKSKRPARATNGIAKSRMTPAQEPPMPALPKPDARGYYPAIETAYVLMARKIIRSRRAAKLTQAELAKQARIRLTTLQKLEAAEHVPGERTLVKIEGVLGTCGV